MKYYSILELEPWGITSQAGAQDLLDVGDLKPSIIKDGERITYNKMRDIPEEYRRWSNVRISAEELERYNQQLNPEPKVGLQKKPVAAKIDSIPGTKIKIKTTRNDALNKIMLQFIQDYRKKHNENPQCNQVMIMLKTLAKDSTCKVIQDVVDSKVEWSSERGKTKTTSSKQVQNRLTRLRTV
jgi:hypothetical protein